ncbi:Protein EXUTER 1, chloroplastic-like [Castilleja foliolosa]|uniref:Protein EXUTER 1, chloroplastic-like n=1 Tax=Castilleja foliolosa TaxID=1961234 RepID=A0ABD3D007_9LAMI
MVYMVVSERRIYGRLVRVVRRAGSIWVPVFEFDGNLLNTYLQSRCVPEYADLDGDGWFWLRFAAGLVADDRVSEFSASPRGQNLRCYLEKFGEDYPKDRKAVNWEKWRRHFVEVDDEERIVSFLKSQLARAVEREDYEDAARIKVAIAAVATNDTIGRVMSHLKKFVEEECYGDAALIRDYVGTGLVS